MENQVFLVENQSLGGKPTAWRKIRINFQTFLGKYGGLRKEKVGKTSGRRNCQVKFIRKWWMH